MPASRPSIPLLLGRAALLRCAWCGSRHGILRGWFHHYDDCQNCGLSVQRGEEGFELGAMTINIIVTFGAVIVAAAVVIIMTSPDIPVLGLILALCAVAILLPIVLYPFTQTLWFAVELAMDPPSPVALAEAELRKAARSQTSG